MSPLLRQPMHVCFYAVFRFPFLDPNRVNTDAQSPPAFSVMTTRAEGPQGHGVCDLLRPQSAGGSFEKPPVGSSTSHFRVTFSVVTYRSTYPVVLRQVRDLPLWQQTQVALKKGCAFPQLRAWAHSKCSANTCCLTPLEGI